MITATSNFIAALAGFRAGQISVRVVIAGYGRVFTNYDSGIAGDYQWLVEASNQTIEVDQTIQDLDGGADQVSMTFNVLDRNGAVTGDFPSFVFEGKQVTIKTGFEGLAEADFCTVFTGYVDTVASYNSNLEYQFSCSDVSSKLSKVVFGTGDDGFQTSSNHLKTIQGHPLDILLEVLNTEVGLDPTLIDTTKIKQYRDGPFNGLLFTFRLSQAPAAADFIKAQLLKPLGGYLWVNSLGQVTVNFFYPLGSPTAVASLGPDNWTSIPAAEQNVMVNTVQVQFDKDDAVGGTGNYLAIDTQSYAPSTSLYGQYGELVIVADGIRSAFQGFFLSIVTARLIFLRYGLKNLKFDQNTADAVWTSMRLEPGDVVAVTHPNVPDRAAGVVGVTGKLFEVLDKKMNLSEGIVTFTMIDASYLSKFGFFKFTSNSESNYVDASSSDKANYMFLTNDAGVYSNADKGNALG